MKSISLIFIAKELKDQMTKKIHLKEINFPEEGKKDIQTIFTNDVGFLEFLVWFLWIDK